jgi:hypothetical protein
MIALRTWQGTSNWSIRLSLSGIMAPSLNRVSATREAEPARKLPKISSVPYLCLTGETSAHATYENCVIHFLNQAGGKPDCIWLADRNIIGKTRFMHVKRNKIQIAKVVKN